MADHEEIYDFVAQRGQPCSLPGEWIAPSTEMPFFHPESDAATLLSALQTAFQPDELLAAGVILRNAEGQVVLHPALMDSNAAILTLRKSSKLKPFALLSGGTCFDTNEWPIRACLADYRTVARLKTVKDRLLVSFSWDDFRVLWALGFPVAPATDLGCAGRGRLDTFCAMLRLPRRRNDPATVGHSATVNRGDKSSISLALVGWSVAQMDKSAPPGFPPVQSHLKALHHMLQLPVDAFTVWEPPPAEFERIRFCNGVGDAIDVFGVIAASIQRHRFHFVAAPIPAEPSYAEARSEWLALHADQTDRFRRQKVWEQIEQRQAKQLIEPLLAEAQEASDPLVKNLAIELANTSDMLHRQSLRLLNSCGNAARQQSLASGSALPKEEFAQWQALQRQFIALIQSLQALRKGGNLLLQPSERKPSSKRSDSPMQRSPPSNGKAL